MTENTYTLTWHENTEKPKKADLYLITTLTPCIIDRNGTPSSYVWEVNKAYFNGKHWEDYNYVLAWAEMPCAYYTTDEEKIKLLKENAEKDIKEREEEFFNRKPEYENTIETDELPF